MKKIIMLVIFAIVTIVVNAQTKVDTLTNEKIIKLTKLGLQPSIIINKIQSSYTQFDVSTDGLIKLSDNNVSADVINEMIKTDTKTQQTVANQKDLNDPKTMRKTGIYLYNPKDSIKIIRRIDPTVTANEKSGGFGTTLAQHYTAGLAKDKLKSNIAGKNSKMQIDDPSPVFYFYFETNKNPGADNWFFASATSPNEFALIKLDEKKDSREMVIGDANAYGSSIGISNKIKIPFKYEEVSEDIYKVTFEQPLKKGEYCFLYASSIPTRYSNDKVFDFGIKQKSEKK